ncbi:MAG: KH domain-containing protein, partial [Burkholderiales bacterium]
DEITTASERTLAAELVREKLFRLLGEELPYSTAVEIEKFEIVDGLRRINACILVDKAGQKGIVIGKGGEKLKQIGTQARLDMERLFGGKVFLEIWVKVKSGWADDDAVLKRTGIE